MPCTEFVNAINWSLQNTKDEGFPVTAYFTKHVGFGFGALPDAAKLPDTVHYASGAVLANLSPKPHLKGTLTVSKNGENPGEMEFAAFITYDVEIYPDGELSYVMKVHGKPGAPHKVKATCVNNVLLTAKNGSEVITVGVLQEPKVRVRQTQP